LEANELLIVRTYPSSGKITNETVISVHVNLYSTLNF